MSERKKTRHFHAGKLRKNIGGHEFVEVAESDGKVFVCKNGTIVSPMKSNPYIGSPSPRAGNVVYREVNIRGVPAPLHRVIYEVFCGEIPDRMEVDHVNTDPSDNRISNLRVVTSAQNSQNPLTYRHGVEARRISVVKASEARRRRIIGVLLGASNDVLGPFKSAREASVKTGISFKMLSNALRGKAKTASGYVWMAEPEWKKHQDKYLGGANV